MSSSVYQGNSIFWVEIQKIRPNPFQPRREFDEHALKELAESIRQYGILQPLVVTRKEEQKPDGGISVYYELIAGERRLRAAKIAGLEQVPVIIRNDTDDNLRLELAILENLQREDLNPVDRALAFEQLHKQFGLTHTEIGKRMGRSRVYVSNTIRILSLPEEIKLGLISGKISEGHTRPLLMLSDRPEEQKKLYEEIILRKLSVRDAEKIARRIAQDKVRKKKFIVDPRIREYEKRLSENLGTRVHIEQKEKGGKILIDYFSMEDLEKILDALKRDEEEKSSEHTNSPTPQGSKSLSHTSPTYTQSNNGEEFSSNEVRERGQKKQEEAFKKREEGFSEEILRFAKSHGIDLIPHTELENSTKEHIGENRNTHVSSIHKEEIFRREDNFSQEFDPYEVYPSEQLDYKSIGAEEDSYQNQNGRFPAEEPIYFEGKDGEREEFTQGRFDTTSHYGDGNPEEQRGDRDTYYRDERGFRTGNTREDGYIRREEYYGEEYEYSGRNDERGDFYPAAVREEERMEDEYFRDRERENIEMEDDENYQQQRYPQRKPYSGYFRGEDEDEWNPYE